MFISSKSLVYYNQLQFAFNNIKDYALHNEISVDCKINKSNAIFGNHQEKEIDQLKPLVLVLHKTSKREKC